jgi:hypothetical protein
VFSSFVVAETKTIAADNLPVRETTEKTKSEELELHLPFLKDPHWEGKLLRMAVGSPIEQEEEMALPSSRFSSRGRSKSGASDTTGESAAGMTRQLLAFGLVLANRTCFK